MGVDEQMVLIPVLIISGLGLVFGLGLAYASKKFEVKVDERVAQVRDVLPGANCGACGQTGCDAFAENLVAGTVSITGCPVGGEEMVNKLSAILGIDAHAMDKKVARVLCDGTTDNAKTKFDYDGILDCIAAANMHGGPMACSYGCVGFGNCAKVCPFDAIYMYKGVARIDESKCAGCEKCVAECPKKIIKMVPVGLEYSVLCSSLDKGAEVRKNCNVGCIGCTKCTKACPEGAITMNGTLAVLDGSKCKNCGECIKVCPTKAIKHFIPHC